MGMYAAVMSTELKYSGFFAEDVLLTGVKEANGIIRLSKPEVSAVLQRGHLRLRVGFGKDLDNSSFAHIATYTKKLAILSEWVEFSKESELIFA